ncbi:hypothetical protein RDI58_017586 [Solanum bulbocastanum]|uniref:Uncharacterized protein n=1 Tax=Solanum bulbocastanum TaxID=147425 RepID=A0AAN8TFQ9_SOLBU
MISWACVWHMTGYCSLFRDTGRPVLGKMFLVEFCNAKLFVFFSVARVEEKVGTYSCDVIVCSIIICLS